MASSTLMCFQLIHWRLRWMKAAPAVRMRSATSRGGRFIYSFRCSSFNCSESRWTGGRVEMALRKMEVEGGLFQIAMA